MIHTNQPVARISVQLTDANSVSGKAAQPYGARSSIAFLTHSDPYASVSDATLYTLYQHKCFIATHPGILLRLLYGKVLVSC